MPLIILPENSADDFFRDIHRRLRVFSVIIRADPLRVIRGQDRPADHNFTIRLRADHVDRLRHVLHRRRHQRAQPDQADGFFMDRFDDQVRVNVFPEINDLIAAVSPPR